MSRHRKDAHDTSLGASEGDLLPGAGDLSQSNKARRTPLGRLIQFCRTRPVTATLVTVSVVTIIGVLVAVSHAIFQLVGLHNLDKETKAAAAAAAAEAAANDIAAHPNQIVPDDGVVAAKKHPELAQPHKAPVQGNTDGDQSVVRGADMAAANNDDDVRDMDEPQGGDGDGGRGEDSEDSRIKPDNRSLNSDNDKQPVENVAAADPQGIVREGTPIRNDPKDAESDTHGESGSGQAGIDGSAINALDHERHEVDRNLLSREKVGQHRADFVRPVADNNNPDLRNCRKRVERGRLGSDDDLCVTDEFYFDIAVDDQAVGRIVIGVFGNIVPKSAANFRALATCSGAFAETNLCYKGDSFHRIVPNFVIQGGSKATGRSIFGNTFREEKAPDHHSFLSHIEKGAVSWAEYPIGSQMFILTGRKSAHLDKNHVLFGFVTDGMDVLDRLGKLPVEHEKPVQRVVIMNCGDLHGPATA